MDADHGADVTHDDLGIGQLRPESLHELVDIRRTGVQHRDAFHAVARYAVGDELKRLAAGANLARRLHLAVGHRDDRLDRQHRAQQRLRAADAASLAQVLERVEGREQCLAVAARLELVDDRRQVGAIARTSAA